MTKKSFFRRFAFLSILLLQTSCLTTKLWDKTYEETFTNFAISPTHDRVALVGEKYHYIFFDSGLLSDLFLWRDQHLLFIDVDETYLEVGRNNSVSGYITIESFSNNIRPDQKRLLTATGYSIEDKNEALSKKIPLRGTRYLPTQDLIGYLPLLERPYKVQIHYTPYERVTDIILTPFALLADGVMFIGTILLLPFRGQ